MTHNVTNSRSTFHPHFPQETRSINTQARERTARLAAHIRPNDASAPKPENPFKNENAEFQEFVDRLGHSEKLGILAAWGSIYWIKRKAEHIAKIVKGPYQPQSTELLKNYRDPIFNDPQFEMIVLYALKEGKLDSMEASHLFCYYQARKVFGAGKVNLHTVDDKGIIWVAKPSENSWAKDEKNSANTPLRLFKDGSLTASDLQGHENLFFSKTTPLRSDMPDDESVVSAMKTVSDLFDIPLLQPHLVTPPALLQKIAEKNNPFIQSKIRPVLGVSKNNQMKNFSRRDVFVPSSFTTPKTADGLYSANPLTYYMHDVYHFLVDASNMNLDRHQKIYETIAKETQKIELCSPIDLIFKNFSNFYLDREFSREFSWRNKYDNPGRYQAPFAFEPFFEVVPQHRDILFFLDVIQYIGSVKEKDEPHLIQILGKAIRENFPDLSISSLLSTNASLTSFLSENEMEILDDLKEAIEKPESRL